MLKQLITVGALLNVISLCAITGVQLHIEHQGQSLVNESLILIEDNKTVLLDRDNLMIELKQETCDDEGTLAINVQTKDADEKLTLLTHPTLVLRRGSEGKLTMGDNFVDRDGRSVPGTALSILASFQ